MAIAALITWVVTAGFGFFMLGTWLAAGGARTADGAASHFRPPIVFAHFLLAAGGLVVWIIYVVDDSSTLAWIAFADLLVVALIGDTLVLRWYKDHRAAAASAAAGAGSGSVRGATGTSGTSATGTMTGNATQQLAEQRIPSVAVALHGLFAVTTVVLVLLAALEVGG